MSVTPRAVSIVFVASLLLTAGCPVGWETPKRGPGAMCDGIPDCNDGRTCGALRACVDGLCEATASLVRECDGGQSDGGFDGAVDGSTDGAADDGGASDASFDAD